MRMKVIAALSALILGSATLGAASLLGPEWVEDDKGDAGPLPGTSQTTTGSGGPLMAIKGQLAGGLPSGLPDVEDMYLIQIVDPESFCATTNPFFGEGAFADFDSRLYLFSVDAKGLLGNDNSGTSTSGGGAAGTSFGACCLEGGECIDETEFFECEKKFGGVWQGPGSDCDNVNCEGAPLGACCLTNHECIDNTTQDDCKSRGGAWQGLNTVCGQVNCGENEGTSTIGNMATDGSGAEVTEPGLYYLAICTVPRRPISNPGAIFDFDKPFEVSGPDGVGGGDPIEDWENDSPAPIGGSGEYRIVMCGVGFAQSICFADLNIDLVVDSGDLAFLIDAWGSNNPIADLNQDGVVNHTDLAILLGAWGDCT